MILTDRPRITLHGKHKHKDRHYHGACDLCCYVGRLYRWYGANDERRTQYVCSACNQLRRQEFRNLRIPCFTVTINRT